MSQQLRTICDRINGYLINNERIAPNLWLYAKKNDNYYRYGLPTGDITTRHYTITLLQLYRNHIERCVYNSDFVEFEDDGPRNCVFYRPLSSNEIEIFHSPSNFEDIDRTRFIEGKYPKRYFTIELMLNRAGTRRVLFFQYVTAKYRARITQNALSNIIPRFHYVASIFEDNTPIKILEPSREFMLRTKFNFLVYLDEQNPDDSIAYIYTKKNFEDFLDIYDQYDDATEYFVDSSMFDLSEIDQSIAFRRNCYRAFNSETRDIVMDGITQDLLSTEENVDLKIAFRIKGIRYSIDDGNILITPTDGHNANFLMRILSDGLVESIYGGRAGVTSHLDVIRRGRH